MKDYLKRVHLIEKMYDKINLFGRAYFPETQAKLAYRIAYGEKCDISNPKTFSEKLIWLYLHTYRNNPQIMDLIDKYKVRK